MLFIPHFSDVGRINELEQDEIVEEIEQELRDQVDQEPDQGEASQSKDSTPQKEARTTKDDFTPRNAKIADRLLEVPPPKKEARAEPQPENKCCILI